MELFCNHCFKKRGLILVQKGPHITALCNKCRKYIKHLNNNERIQALKEGMVCWGGGTSKQVSDRHVSGTKKSNKGNAELKNDKCPGVWE